MVIFGLLLGTVGTDINSGQARFEFEIPELTDGVDLVALAMGMFGISEVVSSVNQVREGEVREDINMRTMTPTREDIRIHHAHAARHRGGQLLRRFAGHRCVHRVVHVLRGGEEGGQRASRFGHGAIEGITAPEAANNAAAQTAFVPTLSLGIPGDAVMALMLGALIIHGIQPGPLSMTQQPELFWGLIVSFGIGNIMLMVLNLPLIGLWVAILRIPYRVLYPAILVFVGLGVYSVNNNTFDVFMVAIIGAVGYVLAVLKFEAAPMLLGFVLGPLMEENLRRALLLSRGDMMTFIERPISAGFLVFGAAIVLWSVFTSTRAFFRERERAAG